MRIFFTRDTRTKPNRRRQYLNVGTRLAPVFALLPKIPDSGFFGKTAMRKPRPKRMFHVKLPPKTKLAHRKDSFIGACLMPNQVYEANIFLFYSTSIMSNRIISGIFLYHPLLHDTRDSRMQSCQTGALLKSPPGPLRETSPP